MGNQKWIGLMPFWKEPNCQGKKERGTERIKKQAIWKRKGQYVNPQENGQFKTMKWDEPHKIYYNI